MTKIIIISLLIAFSLACNTSQARRTENEPVERIPQTIKVSNDNSSHVCNAPTKKPGERCKRRVSNEHGANLYCFMHRGDKPKE